MSEPWQKLDACCADCGEPIDLDDCGHRWEGVADAPDGLPAPILIAVCKLCEREPTESEAP